MRTGSVVGGYQDGFEHGSACRRRGRPFDSQGVADNPGDAFMRGYSDGWRSQDARLRARDAAAGLARAMREVG